MLAPEVVYFIMSATFGFVCVCVCIKVCAPAEETKEFSAAETPSSIALKSEANNSGGNSYV